MFDVIQMRANGVIPNTLSNGTVNIDEDTKTVKNIYYNMDDDVFSRLRYSTNNQRLIVRISIPKYLYGDNVTEITESDIDRFWLKLHDDLQTRLAVSIPKESWIVEQIEVCKNIQVGDKIGHYIRHLSKQRMPYTKTHTHGHGETVEFKNGSKTIKFYDKHQEAIDHKEPKTVIERAKGLLRMEIIPSYKVLRESSEERRACDILTRPFYDHVVSTSNVQQLIPIDDDLDSDIMDFETIKAIGIKDYEKYVVFQALQKRFDDKQLRELYSSEVLRLRKKLAEKIKKSTNGELADVPTFL